jgi:uncharacterized protein (TIGR02246 family)
MANDEQAIRDLIATWHCATADGDLERILALMADDVVFLTSGRAPLRGRKEFAELSKAVEPYHFESQFEIIEVMVHGDWAHAWSHARIAVTPREGAAPLRRSGDILSLFRKQADGSWVLVRDANLLAPEPA